LAPLAGIATADDGVSLVGETGYDRVLRAAEYLPEFMGNIFSNCLPDSSEYDNMRANWGGFVLFNSEEGPASTVGEIICLPAESAFHPLSYWWAMSHEMWHVLYSRGIDKLLRKLLPNLLQRYAGDGVFFRRLVKESFANWMDYKYCHSGDIELFQKIVWSYWNSTQNVKRNPDEYFARSFLIDLHHFGSVKRFEDMRDDNPEAAREYLSAELDSFIERLFTGVYGVDLSIDRPSKDKKIEILKAVYLVAPMFSFFEIKFDFPKIEAAFRETNMDIEEVLNDTLEGVSPDTIDNPLVFLFSAAKNSKFDQVNAEVEAAVIYSFAEGYRVLNNTIEERVPPNLEDINA